MLPPRTPDDEVVRLAGHDGRIVLTSDKDFGELVFVQAIACVGVILFRISVKTEDERADRVRAVLPLVLSHMPGSFVTISDNGVRAKTIA